MVRLPHPLPRTAARLVLGFATALLVVALGASPNAARAETGSGTTRVVSAQGPYTTLAAALVDARPGDTIEVRGGTYPGPLVVEVPRVTLTGVDRPIIDGGGDGTVVTLAAAGIVFRGFEVRGSGSQPDHDHSGITLTADGIHVEANRLVDVLFGIFVAQADDAVVRGNDITSQAALELGR